MGLPTIKFYLDKRKCKNDGLAQIKISICHKSKVAYIVTNIRIKPSQWDAKAEKVVRHPQKSIITDYLNAKRIEIGSIMIELEEQGKLLNESITEIRTSIINRIEGNDRQITFFGYLNPAKRNDPVWKTKRINLTQNETYKNQRKKQPEKDCFFH